jgi:proteic killer suppression protein
MEIDYADGDLKRLATDPSFDGGHSREVVKAFRKRVQLIQAAIDERDFYALKSLHFEKLAGDRHGQHSMRLNKQWRLILTLEKRGNGKTVVIIEIADYH